MSLGPAPAYMTGDAASDRQQRTERLRQAVDAAVERAVREAVAAFGDIAPDSAQVEGDGRVTVDVDGLGRVDVGVGQAVVLATVPPGWDREPTAGRGDVLVVNGTEVVVLAILGDRDDPRPGYRLALIGRDPQGRPDVSQVGPAYTVAPRALANARALGQVEL